MKALSLKRSNLVLHPNRARVLVRPFNPTSEQRAARICAHVMALPESEVRTLLDQVQAEFAERHLKIGKFLRRRFEQIRSCLPSVQYARPRPDNCLGADSPRLPSLYAYFQRSSPVAASSATTARRVPAVVYTTPFTISGVDWKLNSGRGPRLSVLKRHAT